jgi:phosphoribosylformylglycinamidine synthase
VISGNVSLYNESFGQPIYPTPVVGMVGLIEGRPPTPSAFQIEGDIVALLGEPGMGPATLGGSTYLATIRELIAGRPALLDLERERAVQRLTLRAIAAGLLRSAHDCSDGGLAVALAECCLWSGLGLQGELYLPDEPVVAAALLFGEAPSRIIVSLKPDSWPDLYQLAVSMNVPLTRMGTVGGDRLALGDRLDLPVVMLRSAWRDRLAQAMVSSSQAEALEESSANE